MSTLKQPEALRLAEKLLNEYCDGLARAAGKELRRLHAESEQWHNRERRAAELANHNGKIIDGLRARIADLESQLEAVGAGGVGPLMAPRVEHQHESNSDNDLPIKNGQLSTASSMAPPGWKRFVQKAKEVHGQSDVVLAADLDRIAAPQPSEPAYLLRDFAADIGVGVMDLIAAMRDAGLGNYSINMMLPTRVYVAMCQRLYTHPPKREPLRDEQIDKIADAHLSADIDTPVGEDEPVAWVEGAYEFARAIERAHGIGGEE